MRQKGTVRAGDYNFFYGKETKIINWEQEFFVLRWILRKWGVGVCTGSSWLGIGTGGEHF